MKLTTMVIMALTIVALIWINEAEGGKDCIDLWERPMDCQFKDEPCFIDSECLGSLKCKGTDCEDYTQVPLPCKCGSD